MAFSASVFAAPFRAYPQQQGVRRIGFLAGRSRSTPSNPDPYYDAFVDEMRKLGHVEGKNLAIEWRFADGKQERLPGLASELAQMKVEVIVTHSTPVTRAAQRATHTIPIVMAAVGDPVANGFAASLARPGGNISGVSQMIPDITPKQFELLKTVSPGSSRVAALMNPDNPVSSGYLKIIQAAARQVSAEILPVNARTAGEIRDGFGVMVQERVQAVILSADGFFFSQPRLLAELSLANRLPMMCSYREHVAAGGLISYGQNVADLYRRAAIYVDKILKGAQPGELPIEQPTKIHLAINRKTAKALGISVPRELLLRADEVFE